MLTKALVLTDGEADLLSRALEEVKAKSYQESEISLDNTQALNALVSYFETVEPGNEARQKPVDSLSKRLFLGHVIGLDGSTDTASELTRCLCNFYVCMPNYLQVSLERYICPVFHINFVHRIGKRVLVMSPSHPRDAMRHNVCSI